MQTLSTFKFRFLDNKMTTIMIYPIHFGHTEIETSENTTLFG